MKIEILPGSLALLVMGDKGRADELGDPLLYVRVQSIAVSVRKDVLLPRRVLILLLFASALLRGWLIAATGGVMRFHGIADVLRELRLQRCGQDCFSDQS